MTPRLPSARAWTAVAAGLVLAAAVGAARDHPLIVELQPVTYSEALDFAGTHPDAVDPRPPWARFAMGAPEVEVDARARRARIPRLFPGPVDAWAGGIPHTLRLRVGPVPRQRLQLMLRTRNAHDQWPPHLSVAVNDAIVARIQIRPGLPRSPYGDSEGVRSRYPVRIPPTSLGDSGNVTISITNDAGSWVVWERIRLAEAGRVFAWAHLARRERLPPTSAALLVASLGAILLWFAGASHGSSRTHRLLRASAPAAALLLLGLATATRGDVAHALERFPRWAWLALPWALLILGPGGPTPSTVPPTTSMGPGPRRTLRQRLGSLLANGALSLAALAVSLLLAELVLRIVFRDVRSAGDVRTYFHQVDEALNSLGFREREFQLRKPPHVYRIAVIGDSVAYGYGVPSAARFSNRLEQHLARHGRADVTYEVLNFAWPGWDTVNEVAILRTLVFGVDPDFVLLQWYVNDFENRYHAGRPDAPLLIPSETLRFMLLRSSALYSLLEPKWVALQEALWLADIHPAYMYRRFGDPEDPDSRYAMDRIREFVGECRNRKTPVAIILFPGVSPDLIEGRYAYNYLHNRVLAACREEGIVCVDLRRTFARDADYRRLWTSPLDPHPSPLAHALAAERLLEALGPVWLQARPRRAAPSTGRLQRVHAG